MKPMRVLYVCLDPGVTPTGHAGSAVHLLAMIRAWEQDGHRVAFLGGCPPQGERSPVRTAGCIPAADLGLGREPDGAVLPAVRDAVRRAVDRFRPDLLYERYALLRTEAQTVARDRGVPLVLEVNAPLVWEASRFRGLPATVEAFDTEQAIWRAASSVVVPSGPLRDRVLAAGQPNVSLLPNAAPAGPPAEPGPPGRPPSVRRRLRLDDTFVVGHSGSMKPWHDLPVLVQAVARLRGELRAALLLVGQGPALAGAVRLAADLGVPLVAPGFVPPAQVHAYLRAMDVCVGSVAADPGLDYFAPLKVMEYLAAGRPTVVAATGDLVGLVRQNAALLYPPGDADGLARRITELADDPGLREQLAIRGRAVAGRWTWRQAARRVLEDVARLPGAVGRDR